MRQRRGWCVVISMCAALFLGGCDSAKIVQEIWKTESETEYCVERINASTNTYKSEDYFYLNQSVLRPEMRLFRYTVADQEWDEPIGQDCIDEFTIDGDWLYFDRSTKDGGEYGCVNLATGKRKQLSREDMPEELLSPIRYDETCEKIEHALSEMEYNYVEVRLAYLDQSGDNVIGITQVPRNPRYQASRISQLGLRYDILFSYDPQTEACEILYQPKNNRTRIIGYQDGMVYLFRKNKIYRENLDSGKKEELATIPESETYTFDWWKDYLLVLDHTKNELVEVVEI